MKFPSNANIFYLCAYNERIYERIKKVVVTQEAILPEKVPENTNNSNGYEIIKPWLDDLFSKYHQLLFH